MKMWKRQEVGAAAGAGVARAMEKERTKRRVGGVAGKVGVQGRIKNCQPGRIAEETTRGGFGNVSTPLLMDNHITFPSVPGGRIC